MMANKNGVSKAKKTLAQDSKAYPDQFSFNHCVSVSHFGNVVVRVEEHSTLLRSICKTLI